MPLGRFIKSPKRGRVSKFMLNAGAYADRMEDLLDTFYALRPLWLPSLVLTAAVCIGLVLISM